MSPKPTGPTNPVLHRLIRELRSEEKKRKMRIWGELAERLARPRRRRAEVNLGHLNRYAGEDAIVVVPGKVLGAGRLDYSLSVAAFKFSRTAKNKITNKGGKALTISQLIGMKLDGKRILIME
jgi:large subunit ribosomal protein L18e